MPRLRTALFVIALAGLGVTQTPALAQSTVQTQPIDPFGQEVTLSGKTIVYMTGTGEWENAYGTLKEAFTAVSAYLDKAGVKAAGPAMTIYTAMDDMSFNFQAAIPVSAPPKIPPVDNVGIGTSPAGKVLKFVHRGSFDTLTQTYDAIAHYVDEKQLSAKELLVEEYVTDILTAPADSLVINIFVPLN